MPAASQRELKLADPGSTTVARVATDHGFGRLGRFAGAYRAQFGELPSETLSSNDLTNDLTQVGGPPLRAAARHP